MLSATIDNEVLPRVQKPSRYLGTELNSVHKGLGEVDARICLCYPDLYDVGLGNLGLLVLYAVLNDQPGVWAERAYAPAPDLEGVLRDRDLPLFSVESRAPLREFEVLGFTLQYELTYTNLLNMLDLGGVPLLAADREDDHPLVIAGGPGAFNPEPLADFVDGFAIGDGEEIALDVVTAVREARGLPRDQRLQRLAQIPGMYVPALGEQPVARRLVADLDAARIPTDYLVPFTQQIHDRVALEVLRGCTHGCRFCQAGMVTRPVRERSVDAIDDAIRDTLARTGYEGVGLSSLSTCDYSLARTMVARAIEAARENRADVSLPSLRLDTFSLDLADMVRSLRRTNLTFAPEAATDRLRAVINKPLSDDELVETTREVFARGWDLLKLYFMVGLPTERDEDVEAIADLANRVHREGRQVNRRAHLNLSVSTFVPKPHTPFQWERQIGIDETRDRQSLLRQRLKKGVIKFGRHDAETSFLEGVFARADRSIGSALLAAYRDGCRLDGWSEHFDLERWRRVFERVGFDAEAQLAERPSETDLPWDHIDVLVDKEWLKGERERARNAQPTEDCRAGTCHQCGAMDRSDGACQRMQKLHRKARATDEAACLAPARGELDATSRVKLRFSFAKSGRLRWLSHLELQNVFHRALRRANLPVAYSEGFHPHPKLAFASALGVGIASEVEYADIVLSRPVPPREFLDQLRSGLPEGIRLTAAREMPVNHPAPTADVTADKYRALVPVDGVDLHTEVNRVLSANELIVERFDKKKGTKRRDIRPVIRELEATGHGEVQFVLIPVAGQSAKPAEVVSVLGIADPASAEITKIETQVHHGTGWFPPMDDRLLAPPRP